MNKSRLVRIALIESAVVHVWLIAGAIIVAKGKSWKTITDASEEAARRAFEDDEN